MATMSIQTPARPELTVETSGGVPHRVRDLTLAESGRHQIRLAEHEMPGLMSLRDEFGQAVPSPEPASPEACT